MQYRLPDYRHEHGAVRPQPESVRASINRVTNFIGNGIRDYVPMSEVSRKLQSIQLIT